MGRFLIGICAFMAFGIFLLVDFPDSLFALALVVLLSSLVLFIFRQYTDDKKFVTNVFLAALIARMGFGLLVHVFELRDFFGGDANTYDTRGMHLLNYLTGQTQILQYSTARAMSLTGSGWGMAYLTAFLYLIFGQSIYIAQSFCAVFGAATAPMAYVCSKKVFDNEQVARFSALGIALFPSFIIWSGQLLKDGLVIFLLVLTMTLVIQLQRKFDFLALLALTFSLIGLLSLRFYIFYMFIVAVVGSFIIVASKTGQSIVGRTFVVVVLGLSLTYFGVLRTASVDLEQYGNLEAVQRSRSSLARNADSGFGEESDVSTAAGAISTMPIGLLYLMLAPFPWQMSNFRQAITLPEVLLWWAMIPVLLLGLWYTIKNKLRAAFPILIFSLMLTVAYSIFQGNVGTAYRQRAQIQVFLFMFIAVGWTLIKEWRENKAIIKHEKARRFEKRLMGIRVEQ